MIIIELRPEERDQHVPTMKSARACRSEIDEKRETFRVLQHRRNDVSLRITQVDLAESAELYQRDTSWRERRRLTMGLRRGSLKGRVVAGNQTQAFSSFS